jgi:hypothetical protein
MNQPNRARVSIADDYERHRMRQGLGSADNQAKRGIGCALILSLGSVALVAIFLWWLGSLSFWR